jgi:HTH-type transcriptional regulator, sugar sensing transcriptional regulator
MNLEQNLQKIGLGEKEAALYIAGLQTGPATMQALVDASHLKRATVYELVDSFREKGLIKSIQKGKKKIYITEDPQNIFPLIRQKETILSNILGQLLAMQNHAGKKPSVRIYQGIEGIKEIYEDLLAKRQNFMEVLSSKLPDERISDYWSGEYVQRRIKKGNFVKVIAPDLPFYKELQAKDKYSLRQTKLMPIETFPFKNELFAYNGKVAFVTQESDNSLGLVIESIDIYETMNLVLNHIWNTI